MDRLERGQNQSHGFEACSVSVGKRSSVSIMFILDMVKNTWKFSTKDSSKIFAKWFKILFLPRRQYKQNIIKQYPLLIQHARVCPHSLSSLLSCNRLSYLNSQTGIMVWPLSGFKLNTKTLLSTARAEQCQERSGVCSTHLASGRSTGGWRSPSGSAGLGQVCSGRERHWQGSYRREGHCRNERCFRPLC